MKTWTVHVNGAYLGTVPNNPLAVVPAMLKALDLCAKELESYHSHNYPHCSGTCPTTEARDAALSAIAKVEGNGS